MLWVQFLWQLRDDAQVISRASHRLHPQHRSVSLRTVPVVQKQVSKQVQVECVRRCAHTCSRTHTSGARAVLTAAFSTMESASVAQMCAEGIPLSFSFSLGQELHVFLCFQNSTDNVV